MRNVFWRGRFLVLVLLALGVLLPGAAMAQQDQNAGATSPWRKGPSQALKKEIAEREARLDRSGEKTRNSGLKIARDPEGNPYVAGELIVTYKRGATGPTTRATMADATDARVEEDFPEVDAALLSVPEATNEHSRETSEGNLERTRRALEADPNVEAVDYNYVGRLQAVTNDPLFGQQWGLSRIKAPRAWDTATGVDTVIAVLDSGAQMNHPDLNGAYLDQWDYFHNDAVAEDDMGHGTHVSGVAAAFTNNGRGIAGTAPDAFLFNYKVCTQQEGCPISAQIPAITDAADMNADVINMSLAGYGKSDAQARAVNYAWNSGTVVVAAAGNDATNQPAYPAAYTNAIAVSGTDVQNGDSDFSNYGTWVDVAAPAGELQGPLSASRYQILSTYPTYFNSAGYVSLSGTSFAAPMVSGVAALLASQNRSAAQVRQRIQSTATDIGPAGRDNLFGTGLLNARAAVGTSLTSASPADVDEVVATTSGYGPQIPPSEEAR
jgi:thermitase